MEDFEKAYGKDYQIILTYRNNLGGVLRSQRKYREAREIYEQALEGRTKVLEPNHPYTQESMEALISLFRHLIRHEVGDGRRFQVELEWKDWLADHVLAAELSTRLLHILEGPQTYVILNPSRLVRLFDTLF